MDGMSEMETTYRPPGAEIEKRPLACDFTERKTWRVESVHKRTNCKNKTARGLQYGDAHLLVGKQLDSGAADERGVRRTANHPEQLAVELLQRGG
jgi:hypothetical protein